MENRKKRKNIVGIASIPNRVEGLKDTIKCLSPPSPNAIFLLRLFLTTKTERYKNKMANKAA